MKVVAVWSVKGGVGKTTAAVNLAFEAARDREVLLWDLDAQGGSTYLLEVKPKLRGGAEALVQGRSPARAAVRQTAWETLDVLPGDATYRELDLALDAAKRSTHRLGKVLEPLADQYEVAVLDCPPGSSLVARNVLAAADVVVVPLPPSPLSLRSLEQVLEVVAEAGSDVPVLAYLSMVDRRKVTHRAVAAELPAAHAQVLDLVVPATVVVERMGTLRAPVGSYAPGTPAAVAFEGLWDAVADVLWPPQPDRAPAGKAAKPGKKAKGGR